MKQRYTQVREIEHRIRASMQYARWVERNRTTSCIKCGRTENLQVHHIIDLYHDILGLWKFYGNWDAVLEHALARHEDNKCEGVTICAECHDAIHPGRAVAVSEADLHLADWSVIPRKPNLKFSLGVKGREKDSIGLLGFQTLFGIGWGILNGYCERGVVTFNWRRLAEHLGKTPSVSFNEGLDKALESLREAKTVEACSWKDNDVRIRLDRTYMESMRHNPWFMPMEDVRTSKMSVLMLRWFLSTQSNRSSYLIGRDKLASHLQLGTRTPAFVSRCLLEAAKDVSWARIDECGKNFRFQLTNRGMVPIHSLRSHLFHVLNQ